MQATIYFYFSTLSADDLLRILTVLARHGATHFGRSSLIRTPIGEPERLLATVGLATEFALQGVSALGKWTAVATLAPLRALRVAFESPLTTDQAWQQAKALMVELEHPPIVDFGLLQAWVGEKNDESPEEFRCRISANLVPGQYVRYGIVGLGFRNFIGPRILKAMAAEPRDALLAHPLAVALANGGVELNLQALPPQPAALLQRAKLQEWAQQHGLLRGLQPGQNEFDDEPPRWWRPLPSGMVLMKRDPEVRKSLSELANTQKKAVEGLQLAQQSLIFAMLYECQAEDCEFADADLSHAELSESSLVDCGFVGAKLVGVSAKNCKWFDSSFVRADLSFADLSHAQLKDSRFDQAVLKQAKLQQASGIESATAANFDGAMASGMSVARGAKFDDASFQGADLQGADFSGASLTRANFSGANLSHANFRRANLAHANFAGAVLENASFDEAVLDGASY